MSTQDPLASLHPLRIPAEISWWPLAPGWWVLICVATILLAVLAYFWYRHRRSNAYRRFALTLLAEIDTIEEDTIWLGRTNALLKSVAVFAFPRREIAALSGEAWLAFLNDSGDTKDPGTLFPASFADAVYSPPDTAYLEKRQLAQAARHWILKHRAAS